MQQNNPPAALQSSKVKGLWIGIGAVVVVGIAISQRRPHLKDEARRQTNAANESTTNGTPVTKEVSKAMNSGGASGTSGHVTPAELGAAWPLTVNSGKVLCIPPGLAIFQSEDGTMYALNGTARACIDNTHHPVCKGLKVKKIDAIWRDDTSQPGMGFKISIQPLIAAALARCEKA